MHYLIPVIVAAAFTAMAVYAGWLYPGTRGRALMIGFSLAAICGVASAYFYVFHYASEGPCEEIGCGFQMAAFVVISFQFLSGAAISAFACAWALAGTQE